MSGDNSDILLPACADPVQDKASSRAKKLKPEAKSLDGIQVAEEQTGWHVSFSEDS